MLNQLHQEVLIEQHWKKSANEGTRKSGMELREALLILNIEKGASADQIKEKYENMFKSNDPANGGTLYLQAKVFRAKERLDYENKQTSSQ